MKGKNDPSPQFLAAYEKYADDIFRYVFYRVYDRDKAKDVAQEAYRRTWEYLTNGHEVENLRAFLYKTATHIIIDDSRRKKSVSLHQLMEKGFTPAIDPRQKTEDVESGKELFDLVEKLDKKYREVILLKFVEDLSTKEIATVIGETENNVYVRLSRGLEKIKEMVREQEQLQQQLTENT
jgi:RNA polymerase sigma-70 factor (ECF subfamily)